MWLQVLERAEIHRDSDKGPRLHDLRHLFCCLSLKQLIDQGKDPYVVLPILSTYVGHKSTKTTEKYLRLSKLSTYHYVLEFANFFVSYSLTIWEVVFRITIFTSILINQVSPKYYHY